MTESYGNKNFLITQLKIGQSCTLFPIALVCQSRLKILNVAYPLVPLSRQVWWSQSPPVWAVGSFGACTTRVLERHKRLTEGRLTKT